MALPAFGGGLKANILVVGAGAPALNWKGAAFGVESMLAAGAAVCAFAEKLNAAACGGVAAAVAVKLNAGFAMLPLVEFEGVPPKLKTPAVGCIVATGAAAMLLPKLNAGLVIVVAAHGAASTCCVVVVFDAVLLLLLNILANGLAAAPALAPNGLITLPNTEDSGAAVLPVLLPAPPMGGDVAMLNGELAVINGCVAFVVVVLPKPIP